MTFLLGVNGFQYHEENTLSQVLTEKPEWAKTLDTLGRPSKYNWHEWLDGQTHLLVRANAQYGGDYETQSRFFRHTVIRAAEKLGKDVEVIWRNGHNFEDGRDRMLVTASDKSGMRHELDELYERHNASAAEVSATVTGTR